MTGNVAIMKNLVGH